MIFASDLIILLGVLVTVCYFYLTKHFKYWERRNIPHKKPLLLFGNLYEVVVKGQPIASYLSKLYREFEGPYYGFFGMNEPFLVIKDPRIIKRILVSDFQSFTEKTFINDENIDPIFSGVLFTQKNQMWGDLRTKLSPLFTSGKIKAMFSFIQETGENMCGYLDGKLNQEIDAKELAAKYSTDVIATCAFGLQLNSFLSESCDFRDAGKRQFSPKRSRALQPLAYIFAHPLVKLLRLKFIEVEAAKYFRRVFLRVLKERQDTDLQRDDLIQALLVFKNQKSEKDIFKFSEDRLVAQPIIFYVAGNEGISNAIALTLLELAIHPDIQDRLRKEILGVSEAHGGLNYEAVQQMKYLSMVISETFRKYPFTAFIHRRCTENYLIRETGLVVERGVKILIPLQGLHWDPLYFPEPDKFDPERFDDENKSNRIEFCYLPFGGGPRGCIGNRFALLAIQLGIVKVLTKYKVEMGANVKYPLQFAVSFFLHSVDSMALIFKNV